MLIPLFHYSILFHFIPFQSSPYSIPVIREFGVGIMIKDCSIEFVSIISDDYFWQSSSTFLAEKCHNFKNKTKFQKKYVELLREV